MTAGRIIDWRSVLPRAALIVAAALVVYWPALHGGFLWDDELDITGNLQLRDAAGLWRIWFQPAGLYDYFPLKFSVQWLQWQLWQDDPTGYHATNLALHVASALLLWRVLGRLGAPRAWLGGLLFAVHPLAVESVAWITELKNTLSLPLLLLAFDRWLDFDAQRRRRDYIAALALFVAALLCKTSVVMFPVALLLYAWWQRGRLGRADVRASLPFFGASLGLGMVTVWFQFSRALDAATLATDPVGGLFARTALAGSSLAFYVGKFFAPVDLLPIYPQWPVNPPSLLLLAPWLAVAALFAWGWRRRESWGRHVLFGTGWFLLFALPILGFVRISSQRFTWVMDHLIYVPMLGLIGLAIAGLDAGLARLSAGARRLALAGTALLALTLGLLSRGQSVTFQSEEALWAHTVRHNPSAWMALYNLGNFRADAGQPAAAVVFYREALRARPDYPEAWNNLGNALRKLDRAADALAAYAQAVRLQPDHVAAHNNLAAVLAATGRLPEALAQAEQALRLDPHYPPVHRNLGSILTRTGRLDEAIPHFETALRLDPAFADAENDFAVALASAGRAAEAVVHYRRALVLRPSYPEAHNNLGNVLRELGQRDAAVRHFQHALRLRPGYASAHFNLACCGLEDGRIPDALTELDRALRARPDYPEAHFLLGNLLASTGRPAESLAHFEETLRLVPAFAEAHHNTGVVLAGLGRLNDAVGRYEQALQLKPDYVDAHLNLAAALRALGRASDAALHYDAARKLRPDLPPLAP